MAAWPTVDNLKQWIRAESVSPSDTTAVQLSFDSASELLRDRIDTILLNCKAEKSGIVIDEDDVAYDAAILAAWCPDYVHQAILIRAAALYTRRDSANGTIAFGEFAAKVAKMDPDVGELMSPVYLPGIA